MSLRDKIEGLRKHATGCTCYACEMLENVLDVVEKHEGATMERLRLLKPYTGISAERKFGYELGVQDAIGVFVGRIEPEARDRTNDFLFMLPNGTVGMRRTAYLYRHGLENFDEEAELVMGDGDIILGRPAGDKDRADAARIIAYLGGLEPNSEHSSEHSEERPAREKLETVARHVPRDSDTRVPLVIGAALVEALDALGKRLGKNA